MSRPSLPPVICDEEPDDAPVPHITHDPDTDLPWSYAGFWVTEVVRRRGDLDAR